MFLLDVPWWDETLTVGVKISGLSVSTLVKMERGETG